MGTALYCIRKRYKVSENKSNRKRFLQMKKAKFEIWVNGHYIETFKNLSEAQARVRTYERQDRYEVEVEGYTNPLPTYEIKTA